MIHDEWTRNVLASRPDLTQDQLNRTRQLMNTHVRDSLVTAFEYLISSINLPDRNDRHVAAAAWRASASMTCPLMRRAIILVFLNSAFQFARKVLGHPLSPDPRMRDRGHPAGPALGLPRGCASWRRKASA